MQAYFGERRLGFELGRGLGGDERASREWEEEMDNFFLFWKIMTSHENQE